MLEKVKNIFLVNWSIKFYTKFERPISSFSLISGFIFDAVTLTRVDTFWENLWVGSHFIVVAVCIILLNLNENEVVDPKDPEKIHFWLVNILQFTFGGLLSVFLIYYFRSSTILVSWPFLLILFGAFWANESLKKHYSRISFQIILFYFSVLLFSIFIVPVVIHKMGQDIFLLSGLVSLIFIGLFILILRYFSGEKFRKSKKILFFSIFGIFVITNILYFLNIIPPIPLSLKDAGVYHSIIKNSDGNYIVEQESKNWTDYFKLYENFHTAPDGQVYVYSAIFSPTFLNTNIVHEWQYFDESVGKWISVSTVDLSVTGGRENGYRTYSMQEGLIPGKWRVNVETLGGAVIGRLYFNIINSNTKAIVEKIINY